MAAQASDKPKGETKKAGASKKKEEEDRPDMFGERFVPGLESIQDEMGNLTDEQHKEQNRIIATIKEEYQTQKHKQNNKPILRLRSQFIHLHSTIGGERTQEAIIALKAGQMAEHGMMVYVLNINFLKRLATRALYFFIKEHVMTKGERSEDVTDKVHLKIQEEDADEEDREELVNFFLDLSEDYPLFVITDETCQEPERLDPVIPELAQKYSRFHLWSSSAYAHGTPDVSRRYRLATYHLCSPPIKLVMDMIDIDDDDVDITGPHDVPLRRIIWQDEHPEEGNVMDYLDRLPVKMISHKRHQTRDVWQCEDCGILLAKYLLEDLKLGQPGGPKYKNVFIVGSIRRFENMVSISGLQVALLEKGINAEVLFCRRTVKIEDVLKTMNRVVISDSVSVRGVDKAVVVVIPTPDPLNTPPSSRPQSPTTTQQPKPPRTAGKPVGETKKKGKSVILTPPDPEFRKPIPKGPDDEIILYQRQRQSGEPADGDDGIASGEQQASMGTGAGGDGDDEDDDDLDEETYWEPRRLHHGKRPKMTTSSHHSLLRRCVNSLSRPDKDMILDLFTDAPKHAVLFHFAEDVYQYEPCELG